MPFVAKGEGKLSEKAKLPTNNTASDMAPRSPASPDSVLEDQIVYFDSSKLNSYNPVTFELKSFSLPDTADVQLAVLQKDRLAMMKKELVEFYKY